jgi:Xaa-Pro dipeptidase
VSERARRVAEAAAAQGLDALLLVSPPNLAYVCGFRPTPYERLIALILPVEGAPRLVVPSLEAAAAAEAAPGAELHVWTDHAGPEAALAAALRGSGPAIGIEKSALSVGYHELIAAARPGAAFNGADELLARLRAAKDEAETASLQRACAIVDVVVQRVVADEIAPGRREAEVAAALTQLCLEHGAEKMAFEPSVLTGARSALPHGHTGNAELRRRDLLLLDLGVVVNGYCSDITRTVVVGTEPDARQRELLETVDQARAAGIEAAIAGHPCADVDRAARAVIEEAGLGDLFVHRTGHGLGLELHEPPSVHGRNEEPLVPGMVFTVEPGVYAQGYGGVRIEDDVLVTADGPQRLTRAPTRL